MGKTNKKNKHRVPFEVGLQMAGDEATIDVTGFIGWEADPMVFTEKVQMAKEAGCTKLRVRINSCGGHCYDGLAMGDCLRDCGMETVGTVIGSAQSMASYILQCCTVREAHKNATIMIHQPSAGVCGTVDEIMEQAKYLCALRDKMFADMGARCGMSGEELSAEHAVSKYYNAEQALAKGLIDRITGEGAESGTDTDGGEAAEATEGEEASAAGKVYEFHAVQMAMAMAAEAEEDEAEEKEIEGKETEAEEESEETETGGNHSENDAESGAEEEKDTEGEVGGTEPEVTEAENEDEDRPLTKREVLALLEEREAAKAEACGVPMSMLPSVLAEHQEQSGGMDERELSMAELDAMPGMQRLTVLMNNPKLAERYAKQI